MTDNFPPDKIPDSPLFVVDVKDPAYDLQGWLVVHSLGSLGSCGGVRLCPDVRREDLELLARAMTYKYCFHEVMLGGAKAGLRLPFDVSSADRAMALRKLGERIGPLIRSNLYRPWTDMNCSTEDVADIYVGAGLKAVRLSGDSAYFTALSTFAAVVAAAEYYRIPPDQCKVTIEGLGRVGGYLAVEIDRWGGRLVGASTRIGAVADLEGLDVKEVGKYSEKSGDFWVTESGSWEAISREQLFCLPMSIHIPCAGIHSVTEKVAEILNCRAIVPAANVPCTPEGELNVNAKGIKLLPDFVVNSGGIIGPGLHRLGGSDDEIRSLFLGDFREMIERLLIWSDRSQTSPTGLAGIESHKGFRHLSRAEPRNPRGGEGTYGAFRRRVPFSRRSLLKKRMQKIRHILQQRFACA